MKHKTDWEGIGLYTIMGMIMTLSFLRGVEFLMMLGENQLIASLEMGSFELSLFYLIRGIAIRWRAGKDFKTYTRTEIYMGFVLVMGNYFPFMEHFKGGMIEWIKGSTLMAGFVGLMYAAATPLILILLAWISQERKAEMEKEGNEDTKTSVETTSVLTDKEANTLALRFKVPAVTVRKLHSIFNNKEVVDEKAPNNMAHDPEQPTNI